jgi:phage terminase large subunit
MRRAFTPKGAALSLFKDRSDEVLLSGPAGTGKSRACMEKLHMVLLSNPGSRGLILRKTATSLTSTALVTWREHVAPEAITSGIIRYKGGNAEEPAQYTYSNGSKLVIGGMDKATRIMSSDYDIAYVQEAIELTRNDWEAVTTRLRNGKVSFQQLIADTNPAEPAHWLKQRAEAGATRLYESRHEDNPVLFDQTGQCWTDRGLAYLRKLDALTGVRYKRLRKGLWVAAEGQIYDDWDPAVHLLDRFPIPETWPRYWVVDFGYNHPFVLQWWAEDPDGRLYLYRELYRTKRTVDQHAADALRWVTNGSATRQAAGDWTEPRPVAIICDPADAEGRATLSKCLGLPTKAAEKTVKAGIQAVQVRMRKAGDGRPRLFVLRDSTVMRDADLVEALKPASTVEEIPGYVWDGTKEAPVKEEDDGCDAMRYMVAEKDIKPAVGNIRWL